MLIPKSPSFYNAIFQAFLILLCGLFCIEIYAFTWEMSQPLNQFRNVKIEIIEPYCVRNDLHWTSRGYRLYLEGMSSPVDFPLKNYNFNLNNGDIVDVTIRKSFSWFGLKDEFDGINIVISQK